MSFFGPTDPDWADQTYLADIDEQTAAHRATANLDSPAPAIAVLLILTAAILLIPALIIGGINGLTVAGGACATGGILIILITLSWKPRS